MECVTHCANKPAMTTSLEYAPGDYCRPVRIEDIFPRSAPLEVDIGCGDGMFLVAMAAANPERNFIGTERLLGRIRTTGRRGNRAGLANLRLVRIESAYFVRYLLPAGSVTRFYVMFPDPWPKRRHWPRRLVQPAFLEAAADALAPGGELCIKTDDADYFRAIERVAAGASTRLVRESWDEPAPMTDFERHYAEQGRAFHSLRLVKR